MVSKRDETTLMRDGFRALPPTPQGVYLDAEVQEKIKETLYALYWRPLYCLLMGKGFSNEDAKEYTQDFLTQILLGTEFISKVDRTKGKFRSFLVKAFLNHVYGKLRKKEVAPPPHEVSVCDVDGAAHTFDYEWAVTILQWVLDDVKVQCRREGLETHWHVFVDRVVTPALENVQAPSLQDICQRYGISFAPQASNMIVTVKKRFQKTLMRCLSNYTNSPQECREELDDFISIFSKE